MVAARGAGRSGHVESVGYTTHSKAPVIKPRLEEQNEQKSWIQYSLSTSADKQGKTTGGLWQRAARVPNMLYIIIITAYKVPVFNIPLCCSWICEAPNA